MNTSKTLLLTIAALVVLLIMLLAIQLLLRNIKNKNTKDGKFKLSFGILFTTLFLAASINASKTINLFAEAIDNIYKTNAQSIVGASAKTGSLFIGVTALWFISWYFIVNMVAVTITGKRSAEKEMDADNYSFFLIRGILLIGFTLCLLPILEIVLRSFMPSVQLPFFH